jgi:preprotein translocase subunit SecF
VICPSSTERRIIKTMQSQYWVYILVAIAVVAILIAIYFMNPFPAMIGVSALVAAEQQRQKTEDTVQKATVTVADILKQVKQKEEIKAKEDAEIDKNTLAMSHEEKRRLGNDLFKSEEPHE